jgi:hypothetical protein
MFQTLCQDMPPNMQGDSPHKERWDAVTDARRRLSPFANKIKPVGECMEPPQFTNIKICRCVGMIKLPRLFVDCSSRPVLIGLLAEPSLKLVPQLPSLSIKKFARQ